MTTGFAFLWVPVLILGIVLSALKVDGPTYEGQIFQCYLLDAAEYVILAVLVIYLITGIVRTSLLSLLFWLRSSLTHFCFRCEVLRRVPAENQAGVPQ